ncbi:hypothetical protein R1sor_013061 [Riccia sorocarpa]|uniref:Gustatory receptor n=1 Tax=Riccia sorocarpa TaxID=122646 RepID=A0ABD3H857_9MARC
MAISTIAMLSKAQEKETEKSVLDVAEEIRKIVTEHRILFLRIQLVIVLPIVVMMTLSDFIFRKFASTLLPVPTPRPLAYNHNLISFCQFFPPAQAFRHIHLAFQTTQVTLALTVAVAVSWFNLFLSVHYIAANVYAVVSLHKGENPTFMDVLQVIPKLRGRLMVTGYWAFLFIFAASLPLVIYDRMSSAAIPAWIFFLFGNIIAGFSLVASFVTGPIYQVANCIAFCEEKTGPSAYMKSIDLFDRKLFLKASVPVELFLRGLGSFVYTAVAVVDMGSYGFSAVVNMFFNSPITQLTVVCWTFVYIWIKEYQKEGLEIVSTPDEQFKGQFQRVGTGRQGDQDVEFAGLVDGMEKKLEDCAELSFSPLELVYMFILTTRISP